MRTVSAIAVLVVLGAGCSESTPTPMDDGELTVMATRARDPGRASVLLCNLSLRPRAVSLRVRGGWPAAEVAVAGTTIDAGTTALTGEALGRRPRDGDALAFIATVPALASILVHLSSDGATS